MPRNSRTVAIGYPHHITQRGNNREPVFFNDEDRLTYLEALKQYTQQYDVDIWAYCLMPNHIHLLAVPHNSDSLALGIGRANLKYTRYINRKHFRTGRIWQNRFYSCIVDTDQHLWTVARYIENNPVKAGLVAAAQDYRWSSVQHHLFDQEDALLKPGAWLGETEKDDYRQFLTKDDDRTKEWIKRATISGRPFCGTKTLQKLEQRLGRSL